MAAKKGVKFTVDLIDELENAKIPEPAANNADLIEEEKSVQVAAAEEVEKAEKAEKAEKPARVAKTAKTEKPKEEGKPQKRYKNTKTIEGYEGIRERRFVIMIPPSLYADIEKLARINNLSLNSLMCKILADYAVENRETMEIFDNMQAKLEKMLKKG